MKGLSVIYRRELAGMFFSPLAWVLLFVALFLNGVLFVVYLRAAQGDVGHSLGLSLGQGYFFWIFPVVLPPLLTMRMLAEEARTGTLEFLLTAPVTEVAVVVGKFLAATTFMAILWTAVASYGLAVSFVGTSPDWGQVIGGWMGAILISALCVSIGLVANTLTSTPLIAAFLGFVGCATWIALPPVVGVVVQELRTLLSGIVGGVDRAEEWIRAGLSMMDVAAHVQASFLRGVLDTSELVFFATWIAFFLFLTVRLLETRRWRT